MEPDEVGAMIVDAIQTNTLYVITHGEWREAMEARHSAIMAATPTKENAALIESLRSHLD